MRWIKYIKEEMASYALQAAPVLQILYNGPKPKGQVLSQRQAEEIQLMTAHSQE